MNGTPEQAPYIFTATVLLILLFTFSSGCTGDGSPADPAPSQQQGFTENHSWSEFPLTDLQEKGSFSVSTFAGKPVLVSVQTISCPSCILLLSRQLDEIDRLPGVQGGSIISVSLDIDAEEEGPGFIRAYGNRFSFPGYSARAPPSLILKVYQTFGPFALDPAAVPVILVCPDRRGILLPPGVKTAEILSAAIEDEC